MGSKTGTTELLVRYASAHRDRRNIATHAVGIPLIVFALGVLLARPAVALGGLTLTPAWLGWALAASWYFARGPFRLAAAVSAAIAALVALGQPLAVGSTARWLGWGVGSFVAGWALQGLGHYYEGRRPAFIDDLRGLLVGPLFVTAEALFVLGLEQPLLHEIERRAGPTVLRDLAHPVG